MIDSLIPSQILCQVFAHQQTHMKLMTKSRLEPPAAIPTEEQPISNSRQ